jgi:hypothetical protein
MAPRNSQRSHLPRNVKPGPSNDPADKLYACLNYRIGRGNRKDPTYLKAPLYYDACHEWHEVLSEDQQDYITYVITYVIDAFTNWATSMPSAGRPSCRRLRGAR